MRERHYKSHYLLSQMLEECTDELETLFAEEVGEGRLVETIKKRIDKLFAPKEIKPKRIVLNEYVRERIAELKPLFSHRQVDLISHLEKVRPICMPLDPLQKIIDGLVKNAIENTPDESKVEIIVREKKGSVNWWCMTMG